MPLTDIAIRTAKPDTGRTLKLWDGGGLQLWINPAGAKLWNLAFRFDGKQRKLAIGPFPRSASKKPATAGRLRNACSSMWSIRANRKRPIGWPRRRRSVFTCPDCGGVPWQIEEGDLIRYRCHVGHSYTAEIMALALDESLRRALASALRALEERIALAQSLQSQANARQRKGLAAMWAGRAQDYQNEADIIRSAMKRADALASDFAKANSEEARVDAQQQPHVRQSLT
jgi:hypothetical protein